MHESEDRMNLQNRILYRLSSGVLARNRRFKDAHKGESCYIFGNGISLKSIDFRNFTDKLSIGCGNLFLHNDFDVLNMKYYTKMEPFGLYTFRRNSSTGWIEKDPDAILKKKIIKRHPNVNFFTSLANLFAVAGKNIFYMHHFDVHRPVLDRFDMDGPFSFTGNLHAMIGMAIYMGFETAYLLGCDYTHSPQRILHFYEKGQGTIHYDDDYNADFFKSLEDKINLVTITVNDATSKTLKYMDYQELTGVAPMFHENTEIVSKEYLDVLDALYDYQIY